MTKARVAALAVVALACVFLNVARSASLPQATDLQALGKEASARHVVIVLMVSATYCHYCERLKEDFFGPMVKQGTHTGRVIIREWLLDDYGQFIDFQGNACDAHEFASRYRATLTPTVLFLDQNGNELTERLVGVQSYEFYGAYLEAAIDAANAALKTRS